MPSATLYPVPPFDFSLSAAIFSNGDPGIRSYHDGIFGQALDIGSSLVLVEVHSTGTVDAPRLSLGVFSGNRVSREIVKTARDTTALMFSIADDLAPFYLAVKDDPVMAALTRQLRGLKAPSTPTVFEALVDSVIEQQISLAAAHSIEQRFIRLLGRSMAHRGDIYSSYPAPDALLETSDATFRTCGLTIRKGEYIRGIARMVIDGDLDLEGFRDYQDTESILRELVKIRGIGQWTAELTVLRGLHRADAFPADDIGVRRFISKFYLGGKRITSSDARAFADRWGAWKGFTAYYLEIADLLGTSPENEKPGHERALFQS